MKRDLSEERRKKRDLWPMGRQDLSQAARMVRTQCAMLTHSRPRAARTPSPTLSPTDPVPLGQLRPTGPIHSRAYDKEAKEAWRGSKRGRQRETWAMRHMAGSLYKSTLLRACASHSMSCRNSS